MKNVEVEKKTVVKWEPARWEYLSEAHNKVLIITEATAADCFEYEKKVASINSDAAADWLISKHVVTEDEKSLNPVYVAELGLNFADKMAVLQIIKKQDGLSVEALDNRDKLTTKHFKINHEDLIEGVTFTCADPPFNHRASDYFDIPTALVELAKNNITIEWSVYGVEPTTIHQANLEQLPYFVGDVGIRHYSQMLARVPKKKKLQRQ